MGESPKMREEAPQMVEIVRYLEEHGARREPGFQQRQTVMAEALGLDVRRLRSYLAVLEKHRLLVVRRTTVDGGFGSPRAFNYYKLRCSLEQYLEVMPELVKLRQERVAKRRSAKARNRESERRRKRGLPRAPLPPVVALPEKAPPGALADAEIDVLAAGYGSDEDLAGW